MDLEELKKRLYDQTPGDNDRPSAPETFEPGHGGISEKERFYEWQKEQQGTKKVSFDPQQKKKIKYFIVGAVVLVLAVAIFLFIWGRFSFDTSRISLTIFGQDRVVSGEEITYVVHYKNNTKVTLKNAKLTFVYPEGSLVVSKEGLGQYGNLPSSVVDISDLGPGKEGQLEFRANIIGLKNEPKGVKAILSYRPSNIYSNFESKAEFQSDIFLVPLVLDFSLPEKIVSGQELNFALKYLNTSDISFSNLILSMEYPSGFILSSALPSPDPESQAWHLTEISPREEGKIMISGTLSGIKEEVKSFRAKISFKQEDSLKTISEGLASTLVSASPLMIQLSVNGAKDYIANPGEQLNYKIDYQNTVDMPLRSVYIILKFNTKVLDFSTLKIEKGFFNDIDNTITWNEAGLEDLKSLDPGIQKNISFSVKVKDKLPISNFSDKNFLIESLIKIDTANTPISLKGTQLAGNDIVKAKLNSKLLFSAKGYYKDSQMPNSGPLPPIARQQTTYTIYWRMVNLANDVDNVVAESYLPSYIRWLNRFEPQDADIKYDQNSGKLVWTIGKLNANTGILSPTKQLVFQIGLVPSIDQVGSLVDLVKPVKVRGQDLFTGASLESSAESINSSLPDDPTVGFFNGQIKAN